MTILDVLRLGIVVGLVMSVANAWALDVPNIDGHMTDPAKVLGKGDKTAIEDKLGKLQQDTRVDVAGWIVDAPDASLDELGHEAFKRWHIGGEWDNALFFIIPRVGRVHLIQNDAKPELTVGEVSRVTGVDRPTVPMPQRLDLIADAAAEIVRAKSLRARPAGVSDPKRGRWFSVAWLGVALLAVGLSWRASKRAKLASP